VQGDLAGLRERYVGVALRAIILATTNVKRWTSRILIGSSTQSS
jgi:hypothetical protein